MGRPYEEAVGVAAGVREEEVQEVPLSGEEHPEVHPVVAAAGSDCFPPPTPPPPPPLHRAGGDAAGWGRGRMGGDEPIEGRSCQDISDLRL